MNQNRNNPMFVPYPGLNMNVPQTGMYPITQGVNDLENRLNAMERQIRRLDTRISRLEGNQGVYTTDNAYNTSLSDTNNNMYPNSMHMM